MMPRIQFGIGDGGSPGSPGGGVGGGSVPIHSSIFLETFCNPESTCSPVCCCCGLLSLRTAVKGVILIAFLFSTWEICMGIWLLIDTAYNVQVDQNYAEPHFGSKQISRLNAAGWLLICVGFFRLMGIIYLFFSIIGKDQGRKLPAMFCISVSVLIAFILMYPMFIQIPGKGLSISKGSRLNYFKEIYTVGHCSDLLFMLGYSLYCILYFIIVSNYERNEEQRARFDLIDTDVTLT